MFGKKKAYGMDMVPFTKEAVQINAMVGNDELFAALEQAMTENEYIIVNGSMHDYGVEQVIQCFLDRYKLFVESYYADLSDQQGKLYIKLKNKKQEKNDYGYAELEKAYTEDYYMNDCGGYDDFRKSNGRKIDPRLQEVYNLVNPSQKDRILDIGCGRGELAYALAASGAEVTGVDYSEAAIKIADRVFGGKVKNLKYVQADIMKMENMDAYDKVVMSDVVEHIEQDFLEEIFEKISRTLGVQGVLIIHTAPNKDYYGKTYPRVREQALAYGHYMPKEPRSYYEQLMHINEQSPEGLRKTLEKYFLNVLVWTGSMPEIGLFKSEAESCLDNDIFAYACNNEAAMECMMKEITKRFEKPEADSYRVYIDARDFMVSGGREKEKYIDISLENVGEGIISSRKKYPVNVSYHILGQNGEVLVFDGERTQIQEMLRPGMEKKMKIKVLIPEELERNKEYTIRITCVAEGCFWFDEKGGNKKDIVMTVQ